MLCSPGDAAARNTQGIDGTTLSLAGQAEQPQAAGNSLAAAVHCPVHEVAQIQAGDCQR